MLTLYQAADRLGVGPWVVRQLIRRGLLDATQVVPCAPWQIDPARLDTDAVRQAAKAVEGRALRPRSRLADSRALEIPGLWRKGAQCHPTARRQQPVIRVCCVNDWTECAVAIRGPGEVL